MSESNEISPDVEEQVRHYRATCRTCVVAIVIGLALLLGSVAAVAMFGSKVDDDRKTYRREQQEYDRTHPIEWKPGVDISSRYPGHESPWLGLAKMSFIGMFAGMAVMVGGVIGLASVSYCPFCNQRIRAYPVNGIHCVYCGRTYEERPVGHGEER